MDRTSPILDALTTRVKQRVLSATLLHPERSLYLHELAKSLHLSPSTVQHELRLFASAGLLTRRKHGNRVYYQADTSSPVFRALSELLLKTAGLVDVLKTALQPLASRLDVAFVYGSVASSEERSSSDVDLMVIGQTPLSDVAPVLRAVEAEIGRSVNPTVYTSEEFLKKVKEGHHFLTSVLEKELIFVHGTAADLENLASRPRGKTAQDKPRRDSGAPGRRRSRPKRRKNT